jgi:hypothetical protein
VYASTHSPCFFNSLCYLPYTIKILGYEALYHRKRAWIFQKNPLPPFTLKIRQQSHTLHIVSFRHTVLCHILENCRYSDIYKSRLVSVPVAEFIWIQRGKVTKSVESFWTKFGWRAIFMPYLVFRQERPCYRSQIMVSVNSITRISNMCLSWGPFSRHLVHKCRI